MATPILQRKLKNAIARVNTENLPIEFRLKEIDVNGDKRGCSGFVYNTANGSILYVDTEGSVLSGLNYMYRYADSLMDYAGYHNRWANSLDELAANMVACLKQTPAEAGDRR